MKCPGCKAENRLQEVYCRRCRGPLPGFWQPPLKWLIKTLGIIYAALSVFYVAVWRFL